jgi:hypothetical protein
MGAIHTLGRELPKDLPGSSIKEFFIDHMIDLRYFDRSASS